MKILPKEKVRPTPTKEIMASHRQVRAFYRNRLWCPSNARTFMEAAGGTASANGSTGAKLWQNKHT